MRTLFAVSLLAMLVPAHAGAQTRPDSTCYYYDKPGKTLALSLPNGYRVELRRDADSASLSEWQCSIAVRNARDSLVWAGRGFSTSIGEWTGRDIDGDGNPDAVLLVDTGGGNRCCWGYFVLRLAPRFEVITELDHHSFFERDERGRTVIWNVVPFYDLGPDMASSPTVVLARQYRNGTPTDITLERCAKILTDTTPRFSTRQWDRERATPPMRAASRADTSTGWPLNLDVADTRAAVMSLALQYFACERPADAAKLVTETWPPAHAAQKLESLRAAWKSADPRGRSSDYRSFIHRSSSTWTGLV